MCNEYDSGMKTILLSALFLAGIATTAAAQKVHLKAYNLDNQQRCGQYWIDRNAQKIRLGVVSEGQQVPGEAKEGRPDKGNTPDANLQEKTEGNVKDKAKSLLNKGKNLFKKK